MVNGPMLQRQPEGHFTAGTRDFRFDNASSSAEFERSHFLYNDFQYIKMPDFAPTQEQLAEYAGTYTSEESEAVLTLSIRDGVLNLGRGLGRQSQLTPVYQDAFIDSPSPEGQGRNPMTILFRRNETGRVEEMDLITERVWQLTYIKSIN